MGNYTATILQRGLSKRFHYHMAVLLFRSRNMTIQPITLELKMVS